MKHGNMQVSDLMSFSNSNLNKVCFFIIVTWGVALFGSSIRFSTSDESIGVEDELETEL